MFAVLYQLAIAIVQAAGSDAYQETRKLVIKYLSRFRSRAKLEKDLDATRARVRANPEFSEMEIGTWAEELEEIAAISADAREAVYTLNREIKYYLSQTNIQQSGDNSSNQNVTFTLTGDNSSIHYTAAENANRQVNEAPDTSSADSPSVSANIKIVGIAICFIVGILILGYSCSGGNTNTAAQFPQHGDAWPVGATVNAITSPVMNGLSNCAQEPVLSPVNCPQSQSDSYSGISDVHWSLHGDPVDGAAIVYKDKQFQVAGNAVMEVTYRDAQGSEFSIDLLHYRAWVAWNDGQPHLISITDFGNGNPPTIFKHKPDALWSSLTSAVQDAFRQCASYHTAPLPVQCPIDPNSAIVGSDASWQLNNNPVLNAREGFNTSWGLINVTGSFYMSVRYHVFLLGTQSDAESGNYKAIISIDRGKIYVLQIQYEH